MNDKQRLILITEINLSSKKKKKAIVYVLRKQKYFFEILIIQNQIVQYLQTIHFLIEENS